MGCALLRGTVPYAWPNARRDGSKNRHGFLIRKMFVFFYIIGADMLTDKKYSDNNEESGD